MGDPFGENRKKERPFKKYERSGRKGGKKKPYKRK